MSLKLEFVRGDERLEFDQPVWLNIAELAKAFGWKPTSHKRMLQPLPGWIDDTVGVDFDNEDARSLARAITGCFCMLATNQRLTRKQSVSLHWFAGKCDAKENTIL